MNIKNKIQLVILLFLLALPGTILGRDYEKEYEAAKKIFAEGNYFDAMEAFEPLIKSNRANPYSQYALFYYAVSAYHEGLLTIAEEELIRLRETYRKWDQQHEVSYWLARTYFDQYKYFQAMKILQECADKGNMMQESTSLMKRHYLGQIKQIETLHSIFKKHKNDKVVAELLVDAIEDSRHAQDYHELILSLRTQFNWGQERDSTMENQKPIFKNRYTVALLFPFLVADLKPTLGEKINQNVLDLYRGIVIARDELEQQAIYIDLQLYDTQRQLEATAELLQEIDIEQLDLLVGPLFPDQTPLVKEFSKINGINMINPVSGSATFIEENPHALIYPPDHTTVGKHSAEWLKAHMSNKKCLVFFGEKSKDLAIVNGFLERAEELGIEIISLERISRQRADDIFNMMADPIQFDELGNPTDFRYRKNTIGGVFVASDDPLLYTKVISGADTRGDSDFMVILGNQSWLNNKAANFETYERLHITMAAPNFYPLNNPARQTMEANFIEKYGTIPNEYALKGYEFMFFLGDSFNQYGAHFQEGLYKEEFLEGHLSLGYNYKNSKSNQLVPFIYFKDGELAISK